MVEVEVAGGIALRPLTEGTAVFVLTAVGIAGRPATAGAGVVVATAEAFVAPIVVPIAAPFPPLAMLGATTPRLGRGRAPTEVVVTVVLVAPAGVEVVVTVRTAECLAGTGVGIVATAGFDGVGLAAGATGASFGAGFGGVVVFVALGCVVWEVV